MSWTSGSVALFRARAKTFRFRPWLYVILLATVVNYLRRATNLFTSHGGVPVELTHGIHSASVVDGVTVLDVVKSCPSLYGESARYEYPWWLPTYVKLS